MKNNVNEKLCYIDGPWAYFTDAPLDKQWGDDWNDAPYEHNAGTPYRHNGEAIIRVAYDGPLYTPADLATRGNSDYSVEQINQGITPWLMGDRWTDHGVRIFAGTSLVEFIAKVKEAGGNVYVPID